MPTFAPNFITAVDVGSAKTTVLVAELSDNGLRYRGHGVSESRGLRKGVITELDKAAGSIQKAVEAAEDVAGIPIEHAIIGIAGAHIRGMNSHGGITFGARAARPSTKLAPSRCPPTGRSSICCRRNSLSTISPGCRIPTA
jgi:cell division ATPase FtsA